MKYISHKKKNIVWFHLHEMPIEVKIIETKKQNGGCQELWSGRNGELTGIEFYLYKIAEIWRWMAVMDTQHYECILYYWTAHLKMAKIILFMSYVFYLSKKLGKIHIQFLCIHIFVYLVYITKSGTAESYKNCV